MRSLQLKPAADFTNLVWPGAVILALGARTWRREIGMERQGLDRAWLEALVTAGGAGLVHNWSPGAVQTYKMFAQQSGWLPPLGRSSGVSGAILEDADRSNTPPARIGDATQGMAFHGVSTAAVQALIDDADSAFRAFQIAPGRALLCVFMVDYRDSDFGAFVELGVAAFVTPRTRLAALPGMLVLGQVVNRSYYHDTSQAIWGLPSTLAADMAVDYDADWVTCCVNPADPHGVRVTFPRKAATGTSTEVPFVRYSAIDGVVHGAQFVRSGTSEHIGVGGRVELSIGDPDTCRCAREDININGGNCLCCTLAGLGLPATPLAHVWTEHMSGLVGAPHRLVDRPRARDV